MRIVRRDLVPNGLGSVKVRVRTRFDLNPEQEWTQVHVAQTINL